jgi:hypothetical protein
LCLSESNLASGTIVGEKGVSYTGGSNDRHGITDLIVATGVSEIDRIVDPVIYRGDAIHVVAVRDHQVLHYTRVDSSLDFKSGGTASTSLRSYCDGLPLGSNWVGTIISSGDLHNIICCGE